MKQYLAATAALGECLKEQVALGSRAIAVSELMLLAESPAEMRHYRRRFRRLQRRMQERAAEVTRLTHDVKVTKQARML